MKIVKEWSTIDLKTLRVREYFIFFIYKYACKIYQLISTFFENIFLTESKPKQEFTKKRILIYKHFNYEDLEEFESLNKISVNEYLSIRIISKELLENLIEKIFNKSFRTFITKTTGFKYSIDYMIFYDRKFIPFNRRNVPTLSQAYSYRWHFDKPNSKNMLKVFIPFNVSSKHGPLQVIDKNNSRKIYNPKKIPINQEKIFFTGKRNIIYAFNPTLCCHKDGIPNEGYEATQIMFQLNPNSNWVINSNIYKRSPTLNNKLGIWTTEPKFPFFAYMLDKRNAFKD